MQLCDAHSAGREQDDPFGNPAAGVQRSEEKIPDRQWAPPVHSPPVSRLTSQASRLCPSAVATGRQVPAWQSVLVAHSGAQTPQSAVVQVAATQVNPAAHGAVLEQSVVHSPW